MVTFAPAACAKNQPGQQPGPNRSVAVTSETQPSSPTAQPSTPGTQSSPGTQQSTIGSQPSIDLGTARMVDYAQAGDHEAVLTYGIGIDWPVAHSNPQIAVRVYEAVRTDAHGQRQYTVVVDVDATAMRCSRLRRARVPRRLAPLETAECESRGVLVRPLVLPNV